MGWDNDTDRAILSAQAQAAEVDAERARLRERARQRGLSVVAAPEGATPAPVPPPEAIPAPLARSWQGPASWGEPIDRARALEVILRIFEEQTDDDAL
jgi:hypothetical protein